MIDDMASLKHAMEQMDAENPTVAQAAKDRAAQLLADARLNFSQLADLIEQHRLLLRPKIVASIKRMDQPAMLGDAAFRDTGASLRKEGQSFRQIAEALELRNNATSQMHQSLRRQALAQFNADEPEEVEGERTQPLLLRAVLYPFRHPVQILAIAALTVFLVNGVRQFADSDRLKDGRRVGDTAARRLAEATPAPTPPNPVPANAEQPSSAASTSPASPPPVPADASAPAKAAASATELSPNAAANPPAVAPSATTPSRTDPKSPDVRIAPPSTVATNDRVRVTRLRSLDDFMPAQFRRSSRIAGPCRGGIGGCYWGGGHY